MGGNHDTFAEAGVVPGAKEEVVQLATILLSSGDAQFCQGRFKEALQPYTRAHDIHVKVADQAGEGLCKTALGRAGLERWAVRRAAAPPLTTITPGRAPCWSPAL